MHLRPATADDLLALHAFPLDPDLGAVGADQLREEFAQGRMRLP